MKELLLERRNIDAERGQLCCRYSVLVGEKKAGNFLCEAYGVKIEEEHSGESACFPDLTLSAGEIEKLMETLIRSRVTPTGLKDVIEDWL